MSRMNFDMKTDQPTGRKFPWLMLLVLIVIVGAVAWVAEPIIVQAMQ